MSTILDMAIALTLKDMVTGSISHIIDEFKNLEGVTDQVKTKLNDFKNIGIAGGTLFGAGAIGLDKTLDLLDEATIQAATFEDSMTVLMNKSFGKNLIDPAYKDSVEEVKGYFADLAMDIGTNTTFDSTDILDSMTELVKGGLEVQDVLNGAAKANAYFAQVNRVSATDTAEGTIGMKTGFRLVGDEIMKAMELVNQYADATTADSLAIQNSLGNVAGMASTLWEGRSHLDIAKDTVQLVAMTTQAGNSEDESATYSRNFLTRAAGTAGPISKTERSAMKSAGWLDSAGHSIFIDYKKGVLKDASELERILEDTKKTMSAVDFGNLVKQVFQEQGARTAVALADSDMNLGQLDVKAKMALSIDDQVEIEMGRLNAIKDTFQENISNLFKITGEPFLEPTKKVFKGLSEAVGNTTEYFKQHPEVTKYVFALAGGISIFLMVVGTIMGIVAAVGSLKLIFNLAGPHIVGAIKPVLAVMGPVMIAVLALAGVAYILYKNWDKIGPHFQNIFSKIQIILSAGRQYFDKFVSSVSPLIGSLLKVIEKGVVWIAIRVLPMINKGLDVVIKLLRGDFKGAWESLSPVARTFLTVFAPVIATVIIFLAFLATQTTINVVKLMALAIAHAVVSGAMLVWRGILLVGTAVQWLWNIAMGAGTTQTLLQKAAILGFLPIIAAIRTAKLIWTGVQWALNVAMTANPIGAVIMLIVGLIAVIALIVIHFKDIVEWVGKAWDKLKGFKSESKEALEAPIDMTITTSEKKVESVSVVPKVENANLSQNSILASLGLDNGKVGIPVGVDMSSIDSEWMNKIPGMKDAKDLGVSIPTNIDTSMIAKQMSGITTDIGTTGADAGMAFALGLQDPQVVANTKAAVEAINNAITSNLITDESMTSWGSNLIQSFINGMRSKFVALEETTKTASKIVGDYMKVQSPTRKGDMNTNHLWGGNLIKSFADGMIGSMDLLQNASLAASSNIALNGSAALDFRAMNTGEANLKMFNDIPPIKLTTKDDMDAQFKFTRPHEKSRDEDKGQIFLYVYGAKGQSEAEIADIVIKKLEKKNRGKTQTSKSSLVMSPNGFKGGY